MPTLQIDAPGQEVPVRVNISGGVVLVGRDPDPTRASNDELRHVVADATAVVVPSPSVSANHLVIECGPHGSTLLDLGSRNGSWLKLPAHLPTEFPAGVDLRVQLAASPAATRVETAPDAPRYHGRDDYPTAMKRSLDAWLARRHIAARVHVVSDRVADDASVVFPLASGACVLINFEQTVDQETLHAIEGLWSWVANQNQRFEAEDATRADGMILSSAEIRRAHDLVVDASRRGIQSVILLGPSGAGKERLARAFHRHSGRSGPLVALNCSHLDRELARADLFGAEVGAYTGCTRRRIGAVERAHGGTLFLDEIGEMPTEVQPLLLRFLDEQGEFERMGGDGRVRHADLRIVCATNKNLREESARGQFRKDLWWRLCAQVIDVPPLRQRFEDLVAYLRSVQLGGVSAFDALEESALAVLRDHPWEGNFRELHHFVQRLPMTSVPHTLSAGLVRQTLAAGSLTLSAPPPPSTNSASPLESSWDDLVRAAVECFAEDHGKGSPGHWGDLATFVEQYLKPVALWGMVSALESEGPAPTHREIAQRLQIDTKTLAKHLHRYDERFGPR